MGDIDLNSVARTLITGPRRRGLALILAGILASLCMAIAAPAQAHEYLPKAWGFNNQGELGNGKTESSGVPVAVSKVSGVRAMAGGSNHSLARLENGTVMAWGENNYGQLGNGSTTDSHVPVAVKELSGVTAITAGGAQSLALLATGTVKEWGNRSAGGLTEVPVAVSGLSEVTAIAAGSGHSLALLKNGTVMAWGANEQGQLGNGTTTRSEVPVPVCAVGATSPCSEESKQLKEVTAIAAGATHSLALLKNGTIVAWGSNFDGQLGNGTTKASDIPVGVGGLKEVTAISAGSNSHDSLALLNSGKVMAWGQNNGGELGQGSSVGPETCGTLLACSTKPLEVSELSEVTAISGGGGHSLALLGNRTVKAWGNNSSGELGDGTHAGPEPCEQTPGPCSTKPVPVCAEGAETPCPFGPFLSNVKGIAAGEIHSLAFVEPPPTVTAISPNQGPKAAGTSVTITGTEFSEATEVKFGSAKATGVKVNSEGSITAVSPAGSGTVDVTVRTPAGTSPTSSADQFHYAPPTVKKLSPRRGPAAGGTTVTITGANFTGATGVRFGANSATGVTVNSDSSITAVSPPGTPNTTVDVTVTTASGTSATSKKDTDDFKYSRH
jgi:alpha-tubulin suppressor-like RCC1 family protein